MVQFFIMHTISTQFYLTVFSITSVFLPHLTLKSIMYILIKHCTYNFTYNYLLLLHSFHMFLTLFLATIALMHHLPYPIIVKLEECVIRKVEHAISTAFCLCCFKPSISHEDSPASTAFPFLS